MDISKLLPMSPEKGPPIPLVLGLKWPWAKSPTSITLYDKKGKKVGLASGTIIAGQSYLLVVSVTNTSTEAGQPVEASLTVSVVVTVGGTNIYSEQSPHDFTAGETHNFEYSVNIPSSVGGQSGTINATLTDPNGNVLNQASVNITVSTITTTSNLSGTVTDATTSQPVVGATVYLGNNQAGSTTQSTTTDSNGNYSFGSVTSGVYALSCAMKGYNPYTGAITLVAGNNTFNIQLTSAPPTTGLVFSTQNMPYILWSGSLTDLSNGKVQTWGVQNVNEYVGLQPTSGKQILLQYNLGTATNYDVQTVGPLLITMPATSGTFVWDGTALTLGGASSVNLPLIPNRQIIKGNVVGINYSQRLLTVMVTESDLISGTNVGQYLIGSTVTIQVPYIPSGLGSAIQADCIYQEVIISGTLTAPMFVATSITNQSSYPASAFQFSGSISNVQQVDNMNWLTYQFINPNMPYNYYWTATISVQGVVSPFAVEVVGIGPYGADIVVWSGQGPVSGAVINFLPAGDDYIFAVYAHPNPSQPATLNLAVDNWVLVAEYNTE